MKKFNWKALLIAVLVLVLVVALVACNPKDDNTKPDGTTPGGTTPGGTTPGGTTPGGTTPGGTTTGYTAGEFFTELWDMSKDIGNEEIEAGNNVYVNADLELELGTKFENYTVNESTKLGLRLEGVLDRSATSNTDNDTVIKLQLYSGEGNICTLSLVAKDDKNLYIDFGGQKIKLPLEVVAGDVNYNGKLTEGLNWVLTHNFAKAGEKEFTINGVIDSLSGDMGANWSLDNLVNGVLALTPFDSDYIVGLLNSNTLLKGLASYIVVEDPVTGAKSISIIQALTSSVGNDLFNATKNGNHYTATLSDGLAGMLAGMIGESGTDYLELQLSYDKTTDNKLADGLTITADMFSDAGDVLTDAEGDEIHPFLSVKIKDLEFGNATANATAHTVTVPTTEYSTEVAVALSEKLSFAGVKLNDEALKDIEFSFQASLDLENATENKTKAEAYLSYGTAKLLHATYTGGRLAVTIDRSDAAKVAGYPVIDMLIAAFGDNAYNWLKDTFFNGDANNAALKQFEDAFFAADSEHKAVNTGFKGAAWTGIDIKGLYNFGIEKLVDLILSKIPGATATAAEGSAFDPTGILPTVYEAFRYVSKLGDGTIQIKSDDVLQTVIDLVNTFNHVGPTDRSAWSKDGCYDEIENMIVNTVAGAMNNVQDHTTLTDEQKTAARTEIEKQLQEVLTGDNEAYAHVEITGLGTKPASKTYLRFVIESVMSALKASVELKFTDGLGLKVQAGFAGATVTSETKLGMLAAEDLDVTDLAADVTGETAGWTVWDLTELFASLNTPAEA